MPEEDKRLSIDWTALTSAAETGNDWEEDRQRKAMRIAAASKQIPIIRDKLLKRNALYRCSPDVLKDHPESGRWYIRLAGFASKTLGNLQHRAKEEFGLSVLPKTLLNNLEASPSSISKDDLAAFSNWINDELKSVIGEGLESGELAALHVAMIEGGAVIGQGQNQGGSLAVDGLKSALLENYGQATIGELQKTQGMDRRGN